MSNLWIWRDFIYHLEKIFAALLLPMRKGRGHTTGISMPKLFPEPVSAGKRSRKVSAGEFVLANHAKIS